MEIENKKLQKLNAEYLVEISKNKCLVFNSFMLLYPEIFLENKAKEQDNLDAISRAFHRYIDKLEGMGEHKFYKICS